MALTHTHSRIDIRKGVPIQGYIRYSFFHAASVLRRQSSFVDVCNTRFAKHSATIMPNPLHCSTSPESPTTAHIEDLKYTSLLVISGLTDKNTDMDTCLIPVLHYPHRKTAYRFFTTLLLLALAYIGFLETVRLAVDVTCELKKGDLPYCKLCKEKLSDDRVAEVASCRARSANE
jgi:hypothetical protein